MLVLDTVYERFSNLVSTVLTDNSKITLFKYNKGYFSFSYKNENIYKELHFNTLEYALIILDTIEKCDNLNQLLDYLDV